MTSYCDFHKNKHEHYEWRTWGVDGRLVTVCRDGLTEMQRPVETNQKTFSIGGSKTDTRLAHWKDIDTRVTTHEGQFLHGKAGRDYQKKYSKQYLGRDMSKGSDFSQPSFQKELAKTK